MESPSLVRVRTGSKYEPWFWRLYNDVRQHPAFRHYSPQSRVDSYFEDKYNVELLDRMLQSTINECSVITYVRFKDGDDLTTFLLRHA